MPALWPDTEAFARDSDPSTSHTAAERMRDSELEAQVYQTLLRCGVYMTSIEVAAEMGIDKWSISPRFKPLHRKGLVELTEKLGVNTAGKLRKLQAWRAVRCPSDDVFA